MRALFNIKIISIAAVIFCYSCNKSGEGPASQPPQIKDTVADITSFALNGVNPEIMLTSYSVNIIFADTVTNANNLVANFTLSPGAQATINGVKQVSGITKNDFGSVLFYTVTNSDGFSKRWIVTTSNNDYCKKWGLGNFLKQSLSNDRLYSWYFNQAATGPYSNSNCGPSCATMAIKWYDSTFTGTPQDARDYFSHNTGYWSLHTIADYLDIYKVPNKTISLGSSDNETKNIIKDVLDDHNMLVLPVSTGSIRSYVGTSTDPRCDRYYPESFNHFIVAYGYKEVDNECYFQVMDPWGFNYTNQDGTCKGTNRYYRFEDIFIACNSMDNFALIVYKNN